MKLFSRLFSSLEARPLAWSGLSLALGLTGTVPEPLVHATGLALGGTLVIVVAALAKRHGVPALCGSLPVLALLLGGTWHAAIDRRQPPALLLALQNEETPLLRLRGSLLQGELGRDPKEGEAWVVGLEAAWGSENWASLSGKFRLLLSGKRHGALFPGDRIEVLGRWKRPRSPDNPHELSRDRRDVRREIWGSLESSADCVVLWERPAFSLRRWMYSIRAAGFRQLQEALTPESLSLAAPLLLGVWTREATESVERFRRTGAIHLLAVSGMHVSLLFGSALFFLISRFRKRLGLVLAAVVLLFSYAGLTGFEIPVLRAGFMLAFALAAAILRRPSDGLTALGASAWIVCLLFPAEIEGPSFRLSFASTWGMIALGSEIGKTMRALFVPQPGRHPWLLKISQALATSLAAFGASLGVVLLHYRMLPQASIVATLLATPLLAPWMFAGYALMVIPTAFSEFFVWLFRFLESVLLEVLGVCEFVFGKPISFCGTPAWIPSLFVLGILLWLSGKSRRLAWISILAASLSGAVLPALRAQDGANRLRIDILAVGHGNAVVIRAPDGSCTIFDAGSSSRRDLARSVLLPFLHGEGIDRIDRLIASHGDADHWNAIPELAHSLPVSQILCGEGVQEPLRKQLSRIPRLALLDAQGPLRWELGDASFLLWRVAPQTGLSENDASFSLLVRYAGRSVLLCGDLEEEGIQELLDADEDWRCDALLLPHHGLPAENRDALLETATPRWALASCGRRFRGEGRAPPGWETRFLSTAAAGAIRIEIAASGGFLLETHRESGRMPVRNSH